MPKRPTLPIGLPMRSASTQTPVAMAVAMPTVAACLRFGAKVTAWMSRLICRAPAGVRDTTYPSLTSEDINWFVMACWKGVGLAGLATYKGRGDDFFSSAATCCSIWPAMAVQCAAAWSFSCFVVGKLVASGAGEYWVRQPPRAEAASSAIAILEAMSFPGKVMIQECIINVAAWKCLWSCDYRRCCFMACATSRLASRSFSEARLSCCFLPLARPISHLMRPPLKCRFSGTRV